MLDDVKGYLLSLQNNICASLEGVESKEVFLEDAWEKASDAGGGITRVLAGGDVIEKGGVNFSHVKGDAMPASATLARPELAGRSYQAMGVSLVIHPHNPYVPTSHMNVRFFMAEKPGCDPIWWFGGGYDLTPYYPFDEDCLHWHQVAYQACQPFGNEVYPAYKKWCDEYFYLKHRAETRGVGGLFFDDLNEWGFDRSFEFMQAIGDSYVPAYLPILERRRSMPFGQKEKQFHNYRRGRYVEFNLVFDRGTLFGLQSGGRTESILMSMPPLAAWEYAYEPEEGSAEANLAAYLSPRDWV